MGILLPGLVLGSLGLIFGLVLTFASKKFHVDVDERVQQVRECLGGANCGACGYAGCDAFAQAVVDGKAKPNGCSPAGDEAVQKIARIMGIEAEAQERKVARVRCQGVKGVAKERYMYDGYRSCAMAASLAGGPKECRFGCIGLGDCLSHCSFGAITIKDGIACIDEDLCKGCGTCVECCPHQVIELLPISQQVIVRCHNSDVARTARAVCTSACIGCGRCKKECQYDAIVVANGYARINPDKCIRCGACAKVCPCKCISVHSDRVIVQEQ